MKRSLSILFTLIFLISFASFVSAGYALICFEEGKTIKFSECNPNIEDKACTSGACQSCVLEISPGVYCPTNPNNCNSEGLECKSPEKTPENQNNKDDSQTQENLGIGAGGSIGLQIIPDNSPQEEEEDNNENTNEENQNNEDNPNQNTNKNSEKPQGVLKTLFSSNFDDEDSEESETSEEEAQNTNFPTQKTKTGSLKNIVFGIMLFTLITELGVSYLLYEKWKDKTSKKSKANKKLK